MAQRWSARIMAAVLPAQLRRSGWSRRRRRVALALASLWAIPLALFLYAHLAPFTPPAERAPATGNVVLDSRGAILHRDTSDGIRIPVSLDHIAPIMVEATIAAEDRRFSRHPGVDPIAVAREALRFWDNPSGASTITQQLARRLYTGDGGPLPVRKAREMLMAIQLEANLSKDDILEAYLNNVYYGRQAYGIEAAARVYFGASARNLDAAQAAFLAGLPQLPAVYDPAVDAAAGRERQGYVLGRLRATGKLSAAQAEAARNRPLNFVSLLEAPPAPHFVQYALDELARARPDLANRSGLIIETTLDASLHGESARLVRAHLAPLAADDVNNSAAVVLEPGSGRVLAMVGNADVDDVANAGQVNMALALRQPGSALKPFLYAAGLERGYTAATPLLDIPTTFDTASGPYTPGNYDRRFRGVVSLRTALASSFNVPAVRTQAELGAESLLDVLHRFGLTTLDAPEIYGLALTLGGGEVRLLDLVTAYGALANQGQLVEPYAVERVRDAATGEILYEREPSAASRVLTSEHAFIISDILADREARIPGFGEVTPLETTVRAAVKTGTTTGFRDNWTVGYTPQRVVGVWVGNADGRPMRNVSGIAGAAPIWRDVMAEAMAALTPRWYEPPAGVERATVCSPTGLLPGPHCPASGKEWFVLGTAPTETESYYHRGPDGELRINPPVEARAWARSAGLALTEEALPDASASLHIVQPPPGAVLYMAPELDRQEVLLRAATPPGTVSVEFRVDGQTVGEADGRDPTITWQLEPGTRRIDAIATLSDGSTVATSSTYEVRE